jgi:hypothetical protein
MRAVRTHRGRRPLLAAALWASAYALWGCTDGIAQPILPISVAGAHGFAGHGAAGQQPTAGSHSAADGGAAGNRADAGAGTKSMCEQLAAIWSQEQMEAETGLGTALNEAIRHMQNCAGHQFTRQQFQKSEELTCKARSAAFFYESHGGMPFSKPPSMQGPNRDPFSPPPDTDQFMKIGYATYQDASDAILDDPDDCAKLMTGKYTSAGVGHVGMVWVVSLGSN